jgi:hypothetical protein
MSRIARSKKYKEDEIMTSYINFITIARENTKSQEVNYIQKKSILNNNIPTNLGKLMSQRK